MTWRSLAKKVASKNAAWYFNLFLVALIVVVSTLFLLRAIGDPDFFWHLKTGEWIWQNKALPSQDPFSYTSPAAGTSRERFILTSYWLSQIIYHLFHAAAGMYGIVLLRFAVFGALLLVLARRMRGDRPLALGLLLLFTIAFLVQYPLDRPQVFSFLLFGILLLLLDRARDNAAGARYGIPLLMLLWANMHGGHLLGQAVIVTYLVMEGLKFLRPGLLSPLAPAAYRSLLVSGAAGIACSLMNPNTYHALTEMLAMPSSMMSVSEYRSSLESFALGNDYSILLFWFLMLLAVIGAAVSIRRLDITEAALLTATGYFAFTQIRYIAFFLIAATPAAMRSLSGDNARRWARPLVLAAALSATAVFARGEIRNIGNIGATSMISHGLMPESAAAFIEKNDLKGNMYNHGTWGGYLLWRLGPERKVFIDGRMLYVSIWDQASRIDMAYSAGPAGMPYWKSLLENYNVRYIVSPFFYNTDGQMIPLVSALLRDKDWTPVFIFYNSVIFVKNTKENSDILEKMKPFLKKEYFGQHMLFMVDKHIESYPNEATFYVAQGDVCKSMNRYAEAREAYEKALQIMPFNRIAKERLRLLNGKVN